MFLTLLQFDATTSSQVLLEDGVRSVFGSFPCYGVDCYVIRSLVFVRRVEVGESVMFS